MVLVPRWTAPSLMASRKPSGPNVTACTASSFASEVITNGAPVAASRGVLHTCRPGLDVVRPGVRFQTRSWKPACCSRWTIARPM